MAAGNASLLIVWDRRTSEAGVVTPQPRTRLAAFRRFAARSWLTATTRRKYFFQDQRLSLLGGTDWLDRAAAFAPNLIVVHYTSCFVSSDDVIALHRATGARVAWNLLDMAHFTGGCHYAWDCPGYLSACGGCPALPMRPGKDRSAQVMAQKSESLAAMDHVVVAASTQLSHQARSSSLFRDSDIRKIFIGIDPAEFPLRPRAEARAELGVDPEGTVFFFGASSLNERRKGLIELREALRLCRERLDPGAALPLLLVAGTKDGARYFEDTGIPIRWLGFVSRQRLATAYAAADFLICPSLEDSGPMMVNEAMMAGTPVIGFAVGIIPDLILPGKTGVIAAEKTWLALAEALQAGLHWSVQDRAVARQECRTLALRELALDEQVAGFLNLVEAA